MQYTQVPTGTGEGAILGASIFDPAGRKLWGKGHRLTAADIAAMSAQGIPQLWIVMLEPGEMPEAEVARVAAEALFAGAARWRTDPGGRVSVLAGGPCVVDLNDDDLREVNSTGLVVVASRPRWTQLAAGDRAATIKSWPFAVAAVAFEAWIEQRPARPTIYLRPMPPEPRVSIIYCDPVRLTRATELLADSVSRRLIRFSPRVTTTTVLESAEPLARALRTQAVAQPDLILMASTHAPSDPSDAIGQAILAAGGEITSFLAPVDPGSLLMIGRIRGVPVLSAPGCYRNLRPTVLDLVIAPLLAGCAVTAADIGRLGAGGLLES